MRALVVAGARPNFMKAAPILAALESARHDALLVHTGQHYDAAMSDAFFRDLGLRAPDHHLGVGSDSHAVQTARVMQAFEPVLRKERPDWLVVVGDVNSTLACALVAAKLPRADRPRIAHVEAGLRSRDWDMPEEVNRVLTDRLSDVLLLPSRDAEANLLAEGIQADRIAFAGNVMIDTLLRVLDTARDRGSRTLERPAQYVLATMHRPSNVDDPARLREIVAGLAAIAETTPVLFPMHPRTRDRAQSFGLAPALSALCVMEPVGYLEMLALQDGASAVVTDSGGVQEETTVLGVPCVTVRESTERPVTVSEGTNRMLPWPPTAEGIRATVMAAAARARLPVGACAPDGWDGRAAERIVRALEANTTPR